MPQASGSTRKRAWLFAGKSLALAMRVVPQRFRFDAAVAASRLLTALLRRTSMVRRQRNFGMDGVREIALHRVMEHMTRSGTEFDPRFRTEGTDTLDAALAGSTGVLLVGTHAVLDNVILRYLQARHRIAVTCPAFVTKSGRSFRRPCATVG